MRGIVGPGSADAAQRLHEATQGWPAAVRLGAEAVREREGTARESYDVAGSGTTFSLLADEVLQLLDPQVIELVRAVAPLEAFTAELCAQLGVQRPGPTLEALERRGLFLVPHGGGGGWYSLHPLLRDFAAERLAADPDESVRTQLVAPTGSSAPDGSGRRCATGWQPLTSGRSRHPGAARQRDHRTGRCR